MRGSGIKFAAGVILGATLLAAPEEALSLPSFARQTGQPCGKCHTDFPGLTPFGRQFKLGGYTLGGGDYRTTLFSEPSPEDSKKALMNYLPTKTPSASSAIATATSPDTSQVWVPPISMMEIIGFTHTQAPQDPTGSPWDANNNTTISPFSVFWGGAFSEHTGAFMQLTYNTAGMGMPPDAFANKHWTWDNTDIRYANSGKLGDLDVSYGITVNNNPTVQDLWNSTPAWDFFSYVTSPVAPAPSAKTIIDGALAAHVGGVGAYAYINNLLYVELAGYKTVSFGDQLKLGTDPFGAPGLFSDVAPYWRVALEPQWGNNYWEFGTFGMISHIKPWVDGTGFTSLATFPQSDKYTDVGFDSQYQYQADKYWLTLRGTYIRETQKLDSSSLNSGTNPTDKLNTFRGYASIAYGDDNKIVLSGQYFRTWGSTDTAQFSFGSKGVPNSTGWIGEIAYIPFGVSKAPIWPWFNARLGVRYIYYNEFDGDRTMAHANNTVFVYLWMAQ